MAHIICNKCGENRGLFYNVRKFIKDMILVYLVEGFSCKVMQLVCMVSGGCWVGMISFLNKVSDKRSNVIRM